MSGISWTDVWQAYGSAAAVVVAVASTIMIFCSLRQTAKALKSQSESCDVQTTLILWERLDHHWNRYRVANEDNQMFEFGQLISYYELGCALFRYETLTTAASITLGQHLRDVLKMFDGDADMKIRMNLIKSDDDNYENIRWFQMNGLHAIKLKK